MSPDRTLEDVRRRLVEVGGKTAQDLGFSRIGGQVLVYLYLSPVPCSLDTLGEMLGLSKAAVSTTTGQLEKLGFLRRVWMKGDRKAYYRTADDIGSALKHGLLLMIRSKMLTLAEELKYAQTALADLPADDSSSQFVLGRVSRAEELRTTASRILESPLLDLLVK